MWASLRTSFPVPSLPPPPGEGGADRAAAVAAVAATYPAAPSAVLAGVTFVRPLPPAERPPLVWVVAVVATVGRLGLNAAAVVGATARRRVGRGATAAAAAAAARVAALVVPLFGGALDGGARREAAVATAAGRVDAELAAGAAGAARPPPPPAGVRPLRDGGGGGEDSPYDPAAAYRALFVTLPLPPAAAAPADDATWVRLRVAGPNPYALRSATAAAAAAWGITDRHLRAAAGCGGDTLAAAAADRRLYAVDHVELGEFLAAQAAAAAAAAPPLGPRRRRGSSSSDAPAGGTGGWGEVVHSPRALLALPPASTTGKLVPVAIETGVAGGGPRSVVTPADGDRWAVARAALTAADGTDHQLTWHIGRTHLLVNGLAAAARRALSPRHPLLRLVGPHFTGTLSINNLAEATLLPAGGAVDALLPGPVAPMHAWAVRALGGVDLWAAAVPAELAARGVTDARLAYPYRDDALRVWAALATFVDAYVRAWYDDDAAVAGDPELAAWVAGVAAAGVGGFGEPAAEVPVADDAVGEGAPATAPPVPVVGDVEHGGSGRSRLAASGASGCGEFAEEAPRPDDAVGATDLPPLPRRRVGVSDQRIGGGGPPAAVPIGTIRSGAVGVSGYGESAGEVALADDDVGATVVGAPPPRRDSDTDREGSGPTRVSGASSFSDPTGEAPVADEAVGATVATPPLPCDDGGNDGGGGPPAAAIPVGTIRSRAGLARLLTVVIFTASAQHAALNFPQKPLGSYTPAWPLALMGDLPPPPPAPPAPGTPPTSPPSPTAAAATATAVDIDSAAAAVAAVLPPPLTASRQAFVYTLLGSVRVSRLGAYPWAPWPGGWFRHAGVAAAAARLRRRLAAVDADVRAREAEEPLPYTYLAPSNIPMSVDI